MNPASPFWKYWAYNTMKKTWIQPHKAVESFRWTFLDGLDVFRVNLHRLLANGSTHFSKSPVYRGGTLEGNKIQNISGWVTDLQKKDFAVKYYFNIVRNSPFSDLVDCRCS